MTEKNSAIKIIYPDMAAVTLQTPRFRVSHPAIFEMTEFKGKSQYALTMLFPSTTDLKPLKAAARLCLVAHFGPDQKKWPQQATGDLWLPFRDGNKEKPGVDGYEDAIFVKAVNKKNRPGLVGTQRGPDGKLLRITEPSDFYAGCYARAEVRASLYLTAANKGGISFILLNVQKLADGEPFGAGQASPESVFDDVTDSSEDPSSYEDSGASLGL